MLNLLLLAATVSVGEITMPTYPFSDPDPVPAVRSKRYPYFRYDGSSATSAPKAWRTVTLENGRIRVLATPEIGGKIWCATDLATGTDFIYRNRVVKFRDVAMRGPWTSGGIEFNFGIVGHGATCSTPVDWCVRTNADGSVSYFVAADDYITRTWWQTEVRLRPDAEEFETHAVRGNGSGLVQPCYHWMNAAYSLRGNPRFLFPGATYVGHAGDAHAWPEDPAHRRLDLLADNAFGTHKSYHVLPGDSGFYGIWWADRNIGSYHRNEPYEKYGRKIWLWALSRAGGIWEDLLTDADGQYTELQSGRCLQQPAGKSVDTPFDHPYLHPGATESYVEHWGVLRSPKVPEMRADAPAPAPRPLVRPADFDPASAEAHYLKGRHAFSDRDNTYAEAAAHFRAALAVDPHHRSARIALAALACRRGDYADCHAHCRDVLAIDTYDEDANYYDGFAYFAEGDDLSARDRLGVAAFGGRYRAAALVLIARTFLRAGDADRADAVARKALAADADSREARWVRLVAARGTDRPRALADEALARYPLFHAARFERDGDSFRSLVRNELPAETYLEMGSWYEENGDRATAARLFAFAGDHPIALIRAAYLARDPSRLDAAAARPAAGVFPFRRETLPALRWAAAAHAHWKFRYWLGVACAALDLDDEADRAFAAVDAADEPVPFLARAARRTGSAQLADLRRADGVGPSWRTARALCDWYAGASNDVAFLAETTRALAAYPTSNAIQMRHAKALVANAKYRECLDFLKGIVFLPSELRENAMDPWHAAQDALGLPRTWPENLGAGEPFAADAKTPRAVRTKLMSFNVRHCAGMDGKLDVERTAARIRAENPDYAGLQELDCRTTRANGVDQPAELARLTGLHATFARAIPFAGGEYGVMLLSREKPLNVIKVPLPGAEPRVLLLCEFADRVVGTTHLSVSAESERAESIALIRKALAPYAGRKPVFLTGDWNSTADSAVLKGLGAFLRVLSETRCQTFHGATEAGPSGQPRDMSTYCIDYIACDAEHARDFTVRDARVVEDRSSSDHAPIVVTIEAARR